MAKHGKVKDSGAYFVINPASRKVIVPHVHKSIGTVGDHNSEQITFECPQMIDGHDISQCASRYVTWVNVRGEVGHDELQITQVEQGTEGMLYLSWTVRNGLTVAKGIIQFSVHFEDFDDDGNILYRWGTATCKDCEILDSVNAVLGAYKAVYVAGDTLVFADYNFVKDGVLKIETNGLIPEGILSITENGTFDVGRYAQVDVAVDENPPEITISKEGKITAKDGDATSEVQLSNKHDPDFIAENIKSGVNIFGIQGTFLTTSFCSIRYVSMQPIHCHLYYIGNDDENGISLVKERYYDAEEESGNEYLLCDEKLLIAPNTFIVLIVDKPFNDLNVQVTVSYGTLLESINYGKTDKAIFVIKLKDCGHIEISDDSFGMG